MEVNYKKSYIIGEELNAFIDKIMSELKYKKNLHTDNLILNTQQTDSSMNHTRGLVQGYRETEELIIDILEEMQKFKEEKDNYERGEYN